jgi:hypothetical protein
MAPENDHRPIQLPSLTTVPRLQPLNIRKHSHNNLLDKTTNSSPTVLRSPPETTADMGGRCCVWRWLGDSDGTLIGTLSSSYDPKSQV